MKTMTCQQLGGAGDMKFLANFFDEIAEISKVHGMKMSQKKDAKHLQAMAEMSALMQQNQAMQNRLVYKHLGLNVAI